jgi:hypothetical protein
LLPVAFAAAFAAVLCPPAVHGGRHPCLLISADDLPQLRAACGVAAAPADSAAESQPALRAGHRASEFNALREYFARRADVGLLPGEISAAAFLHLVAAENGLEQRRLDLINEALREPLWVGPDPFELMLAVDWCWDALDPEARRDFLLAVRDAASPFTPADSPFDHRAFAAKLLGVAAAVAIDEHDEPAPSWAEWRQPVLDAAREYFRKTLPTVIAWRGLTPTSPSAGPWEERDVVLALELAGAVLSSDVWSGQRNGVGRWLEHYVYASFSHPALQHHFIRDDGQLAPLSPACDWAEMLPVTAHLIAARTHDPAAVFIARRVEQRLRGPTADPLAQPWQWVPIALETRGLAGCDFSRLPTARNLGGAVVFRGPATATETGIWIEAAQPFLRRRQHFDAGHFLLYSDGQLLVGAGDDVVYEAVQVKQGAQHLGDGRDPFDFDQYFTATIAHNCLLLWDPLRAPRWHGNRYEAIGGQRLIEDTCTDFTTPLAENERLTGRQVAYGQHDGHAYVALNLQSAYEARSVSAYTREFVFLAGRTLVVIDRLHTRSLRCQPISVVTLPACPLPDGQPLTQCKLLTDDEQQDRGIWQCDQAQWFQWSDADGTLRVFPLLPEPRRVHVCGGPAEKSVVSDGPHAGRLYVGGSATGFERLVRPAGHAKPANAWYELGRPTVLGPAVGAVPLWGRLEIEPLDEQSDHVFITVYTVESARQQRTPTAELKREQDELRINIDNGETRTTLWLRADTSVGGRVLRDAPGATTWTLPKTVEADTALPTD